MTAEGRIPTIVGNKEFVFCLPLPDCSVSGIR